MVGCTHFYFIVAAVLQAVRSTAKLPEVLQRMRRFFTNVKNVKTCTLAGGASKPTGDASVIAEEEPITFEVKR